MSDFKAKMGKYAV